LAVDSASGTGNIVSLFQEISRRKVTRVAAVLVGYLLFAATRFES